MEFRISYRAALLQTLVINLLTVAFWILFTKLVLSASYDSIIFKALGFVVFVNAALLLQFLLKNPPQIILVDKDAGVVAYGSLFRSKLTLFDYKSVWGQFTTRTSRNGIVKGLSLFSDNKEQFFIEFNTVGWSEAQLQKIYELLNH